MKTQHLPKTDSIQELAQFWDTHDLTDFEDELEEVTEPVFEPTTAISLNLEAEESYIETLRSRSELAITDTELKLIAAAAIIGLSKIPKKG